MLKGLVLLLVAANLAFFAWTQGWLAPMLKPPMSSEREPERMSQQLRPETVRLLDDPAARAARRGAEGGRGPTGSSGPNGGASAAPAGSAPASAR